VEDGLSECETALACLAYYGTGNVFDEDTGINSDAEGRGKNTRSDSTIIV